MTRTVTTSSMWLIIFIFSLPGRAHPVDGPFDDVVLIEDFEAASYGKWKVEGDAFGKGPIEEDMVGVLGSRVAASTGGSGVGTLTSPLLAIERKAIYLLVGAIEIDGPPQEVAIELLVDGDVVRTATASRYHAMFWESWDVAEFEGEKARIRIIDRDERGDAFIFVDHIIQSSVPAERPLLERIITVTKPVLNFPLKTGVARHYIELVVDSEQIRAMDVELATDDDIDYWVVTDLSPWLGKELLMRTRQHPLGNPHVLDRISVEDGIRDAEDLYREALRPRFHFSPKRGWISDTNGLIYYDGEYHLELFDIDAEFEIGDADEFGFFINGFSIRCEVDDNQLSCEDSKARLKPIDGKIRLRILVDRVSIEIFANDGRIYMPIRAIPETDERMLEVFTEGGETEISSLRIHELKSIWK